MRRHVLILCVCGLYLLGGCKFGEREESIFNYMPDEKPKFLSKDEIAAKYPKLYGAIRSGPYYGFGLDVGPAVQAYINEPFGESNVFAYWVLVSRLSEAIQDYEWHEGMKYDPFGHNTLEIAAQKRMLDRAVLDGLGKPKIPAGMRLAALEVLKMIPGYILDPTYLGMLEAARNAAGDPVAKEIDIVIKFHRNAIGDLMSVERGKRGLGITIVVALEGLEGKEASLPVGEFHGVRNGDVLSLHMADKGDAFVRLESVRRFNSIGKFVPGSCPGVISSLRWRTAVVARPAVDWERKLDGECE